MLFNSFSFAIFFPFVTIGYFAVRTRWQWALLLAASCVFYMAFIPAYVLILFGMILVDYAAGLLIDRAEGPARKAFLAVSLGANLGVLAVFKYYAFVARMVSDIAPLFHASVSPPLLGWVLPIGLSFHTFQAMAYNIEVYRRAYPAERHLGRYALYVMFYPQLVAGPIERPQHLLPQLRTPHTFDAVEVAAGLKLMAWGLFKKVVIADRLALTVNLVYAQPHNYSGPVLALATFLFAWQIYCDFSGYSDIAIGAAQVMGFRLMTNFDRPYLATSVRQFWSRWHISLSSWFRDYVYIPLGGSHTTLRRRIRNILITFALSGLWHGANWTFVIWGALNGLYLAAGVVTSHWSVRVRAAAALDGWPRLGRAIRTAITFALITSTWVFFRASSSADAWFVYRRMFGPGGSGLAALGIPASEYALSFALIIVLCMIEALQAGPDPREMLRERPSWIRWTVYYAVICATIAIGVFNRSQFIYFQF